MKTQELHIGMTVRAYSGEIATVLSGSWMDNENGEQLCTVAIDGKRIQHGVAELEIVKKRQRLLIHPLRNGQYILVRTVESRNGLMFKHLRGCLPFGEQTKELAVEHLGRGAFTFMQLHYSPYPY